MEIWLLIGKDMKGNVLSIDAFRDYDAAVGIVNGEHQYNSNVVEYEVRSVWVRG